jgi:hypothetical protein
LKSHRPSRTVNGFVGQVTLSSILDSNSKLHIAMKTISLNATVKYTVETLVDIPDDVYEDLMDVFSGNDNNVSNYSKLYDWLAEHISRTDIVDDVEYSINDVTDED